MCVPPPMPAEVKLISPGFCFASAMSSLTDLTPAEGATTSTLGTLPTREMPAKSFTASYGSLE
jgi:hypothetical protein